MTDPIMVVELREYDGAGVLPLIRTGENDEAFF